MVYFKIALVSLSLLFPQIAYESEAVITASEPARPSYQAVVEHPTAPPMPLILQKIAECESRGRQFNDDGTVLRGVHNQDDIGKYQINEKIWGGKARMLGFDLYTEEGNEAMALELYRRYSTEPWIWSKQCWNT